jgi:valyl-tRNA synthetase
VFLNGHILGPDGSRMSKSKGNVIMPEQGVNEYGADAIRQAVLSLTLGSDFPFKWEPVKYGKGFMQKVWSSVRFAEGFLNGPSYSLDGAQLEDVDRWILSRLRETMSRVAEAMEDFQFHIAVDLLQRFYWHDFCDHYIEAVKPRLYEPPSAESQEAAKATLYTVIWNFTRLLAPLCPHITEEIFQNIFRQREGGVSIHAAPYPRLEGIPVVDGGDGGILVKIISDLRTKKVEGKMALSAEVPKARVQADERTLEVCRRGERLIRSVLHIREIEFAVGDFKTELVVG